MVLCILNKSISLFCYYLILMKRNHLFIKCGSSSYFSRAIERPSWRVRKLADVHKFIEWLKKIVPVCWPFSITQRSLVKSSWQTSCECETKEANSHSRNKTRDTHLVTTCWVISPWPGGIGDIPQHVVFVCRWCVLWLHNPWRLTDSVKVLPSPFQEKLHPTLQVPYTA